MSAMPMKIWRTQKKVWSSKLPCVGQITHHCTMENIPFPRILSNLTVVAALSDIVDAILHTSCVQQLLNPNKW